jgi:hypothetical protein
MFCLLDDFLHVRHKIKHPSARVSFRSESDSQSGQLSSYEFSVGLGFPLKLWLEATSASAVVFAVQFTAPWANPSL